MDKGGQKLVNRLVISLLVLWLCTLPGCCTLGKKTGGQTNQETSGAEGASGGPTALPEDAKGALDFSLINYTGTSLRAIYLSPSDSTGWEENVIGSDNLDDGDTLSIRFNPQERAGLWDLKIEGVDGHFAEWQRLNLRDISSMTLKLQLKERPVVVAEIE